MLMKKPLVEHN